MNHSPPAGRHHLWCLLGWLLCSALYLGTANGVAVNDGDRNNAWHHYQYLVDGFLGGHTYLSREPAKELLALADPYDPVQNVHYRLWDASLYHGKYYLYYGPTPALLLMLPWKVITGAHLPQRLATGFFACAGLGALALLLAGVRRRYFPSVTPLQLFFAVVIAGHVSWLPVILRRPAFWELPIVTAAALFWWSLYFLWRFHDSGGWPRWAWAGGLALALALGARPTYLFCTPVFLLLFALPFNRIRPVASFLQRMLPVAIPLACSGLGLLAYNYLRFGDAREFGQHYQVWGVEYRGLSLFSVKFLSFNTWLYFLSLPELSPYFPFLRTVWVNDPPAGYFGIEEMPGLLFTMPFLLLGIAALIGAWRGPSDPARGPLRRLLLAATLGGALTCGILFCFGGACSRYITEALAGWSVVTAVGFLALFAPREKTAALSVARLLGALSIIWSIAGVWLASFEFRAFARMSQPAVYNPVAEILNYPSYWAARQAGQVYGPVSFDIRLPDAPATGTVMLLAMGRLGMMNELLIERTAPDQVRLRLMANEIHIVETPMLHHAGPLLHVECDAPWLYPPAAHPYWKDYTDAAERERRQSVFGLRVEGVWYAQRSPWIFDATRFEPFVRTAAYQPPACAWIENLHRSNGHP